MSRVGSNPTSRRLTSFTNLDGCIPGDGSGSQAQPIRPDDYDDSRTFNRRREMIDRPPLDEDPLIRM